jgi:hypothetical protein
LVARNCRSRLAIEITCNSIVLSVPPSPICLQIPISRLFDRPQTHPAAVLPLFHPVIRFEDPIFIEWDCSQSLDIHSCTSIAICGIKRVMPAGDFFCGTPCMVPSDVEILWKFRLLRETMHVQWIRCSCTWSISV